MGSGDGEESWEPGMSKVSAIMITADRPHFVPMAIGCFLAQTYEPKELVIVDDGREPCLLPGYGALANPQIRYVYINRREIPVGAKWNIAVEAALGDYLVFWADDDWHHPERIQRQLTACLVAGAEACALGDVPYVDLTTGERWRFTERDGRVLDGTYLFSRGFTNRGNFPRTTSPEAANWLNGKPKPTILHDDTLYLGTVHGSNAWGFFPETQWSRDLNPSPLPAKIECLVGHPGVVRPNSELVFKVDGWAGEDLECATWPVEAQAKHAAKKLLAQSTIDPFKRKLIVVVLGQAFRVLDRTPRVEPTDLLPLGEELIKP